MTLTMGKKGTIVIPKAIRDECKLGEGVKIDVSFQDNTIVLTPSVKNRTRIDENFDEARALLTGQGVTLEMALAKLTEIKAHSEQAESRSRV